MTAAKHILLIIAIALTLFTLDTTALVPYYTRSPLWDTLLPFEDPFRVIEQTPLNMQKPTHETLALARADWKETSKEHVITLDVPGIKKEEIKIEVEDNRVLRVSGERKSEELEEGSEGEEKWHRVERTNGKFWRQFRMHGNVDLDKVKARLENGVLRISVPKVGDVKRKPTKVIGILEEGKGGEDLIKASKADM